MPDHMRQVTEALKAQPFSSVNTPFTSSHRQQSHESPLERVPSDTSSLSTGIVDPNRMIKPHQRRGNLPPLPDLRFEQSYLASISAADTWGRIAWITIRDQVRIFSCWEMINPSGFVSFIQWLLMRVLYCLGPLTVDARHVMDSRALWLEILAPWSEYHR